VDTDSHNGDRPRSPLLEIKGLTKRFPGVTALNAVDLSLAPAEIHALVGENGAGKSTLIKLLCGSYIPDVGEMRFCGAPYTPQSPLDALEAGIRVVYQEFNLLPYLSVAENLLFDCLPRRYGLLLDYRTLHKRASALLKQVGLDVDPHISVERLGIAQRQLLEIGKALREPVANPRRADRDPYVTRDQTTLRNYPRRARLGCNGHLCVPSS